MRSPDSVYAALVRRRQRAAEGGPVSLAIHLAEYVERYLEVRGRGDIGEHALRDLMLCVAPERAAAEDARAAAVLRRIHTDAAARERAWWRRVLRAIGIGRARAS